MEISKNIVPLLISISPNNVKSDKVIEFIDPKSDLAKKIDKEYWVKKETEKPKHLPSQVVEKVREAGFKKFRIHPDHTNMWKSGDAKNPGKGYGVQIANTWYWYESWINRCIELCERVGEKYK